MNDRDNNDLSSSSTTEWIIIGFLGKIYHAKQVTCGFCVLPLPAESTVNCSVMYSNIP
jgi:hypothetical protein